MAIIRNKAAGPRIFNLKGGAPGQVPQRTLLPGEVADLDLLVDVERDPILKHWRDNGEIEVGGADGLDPLRYDAAALSGAQERLAAARAEVDRLSALQNAAEFDLARQTPPRQLASDGGPLQVPTVDGTGGGLTPSQVANGRQEPATGSPTVAARTPAPTPAPLQTPRTGDPKPVAASPEPAAKK